MSSFHSALARLLDGKPCHPGLAIVQLLRPVPSTRSRVLGIVASRSCISLSLLFSHPLCIESARAFTSVSPHAFSGSLASYVHFPPRVLGFLASWPPGLAFGLTFSSRYCSRVLNSELLRPFLSIHSRIPLVIVLDSLTARVITSVSLRAFSDSSHFLLHLFLDSIATTYVTKPKSFTLCNIQFNNNNNHAGGDLGPCVWRWSGIGRIVGVEFETSVTVMVALR